MKLELLKQTLAVTRLEPDASLPDWAIGGSFSSITRTPDEISIFCDSDIVPDGPGKIDGWRALRVAGQLEFNLTGVISGLAMPLAAKQITIFSLSTYDTDYMLVQQDQLEDALDVLRRSGHTVRRL